jgi:hypothetical protein
VDRAAAAWVVETMAAACHAAAEAETVGVTVDRAAVVAATDVVNESYVRNLKNGTADSEYCRPFLLFSALNPESVLLALNPERSMNFGKSSGLQCSHTCL